MMPGAFGYTNDYMQQGAVQNGLRQNGALNLGQVQLLRKLGLRGCGGALACY
jgi:hypothetical protein